MMILVWLCRFKYFLMLLFPYCLVAAAACDPPAGMSTVVEGQVVILGCEAEFYGYHPPKLEWYNNLGYLGGTIQEQELEEDEIPYIHRSVRA